MSERKLDEESSLPRERYFSEGYFERSQLISQAEQIALVHESKANSLLEIGHGNGFVSSFLKRAGYSVTTLDINSNLEPDVNASITDLDDLFEPGSFDCVLCCEVLEHLSFETFPSLVRKLSDVTSQSAIISLPTAKRQLLKVGFAYKFHHSSEKFFGLRIRRPWKKLYSAHHWEIDYAKPHSLRNVISILSERFSSVRTKTLEQNPYHTFFICEK